MRNKIHWSVLSVLVLSFVILTSFINNGEEVQEEKTIPVDYKSLDFIKPIDLPFKLSGNFGEIRSNHFHSGLDIKTNGEIGYPIYSIADGYVWRVRVSPYGYGKVIYVAHPNGFTSIYAHLNEFSGDLAKYVKKEQYNQKSFAVDLYPPAGHIVVKQGQVIAKSGNSGGSGGPHLHFEIRETKTSKPINPLLFNYALPDSIDPIIKSLTLYSINDQSGIVASNTFKASDKLSFPVRKVNGVYRVVSDHPIKVKGRIGFGVETFDRASLSRNTLGVYSIDTYVENERISYFKSDRFSFMESRYVNSLIDYAEKYDNGNTITRTYRLPGNKLSMYMDMEDKGIYNFKEEKGEKDIVIVVKDIEGNTSVLKFKVHVTDEYLYKQTDNAAGEKMYFYNDENTLTDDGIYAKFPKYAFYKSFFFKHEVIDSCVEGMCYSSIHKLDEPSIPVHKYYELKIKPKVYEERLKDKYLIASIKKSGGLESQGGVYVDGYVYAKTKKLGRFMVAVDTVAPVIKPVNVYNGKRITSMPFIDFEVKDEFSGLDFYEGTVNGQWILMDYDAKKDKLRYYLDENFPRGEHVLKITAIDDKGNEAYYSIKLVR